ncbi:anthranilate synthase component 1 [Corynebacterium choanae]|uniref:anthranilate synthase n=1 Tax=Corynebacterium choanae TaxID=1862358 RepID=A0A3G6JDG6_9CORY|nr:anthranilate synthase component 1 [Corynebacterium choanae]AZA14710.1 Anthranilate synthase component 1 [Corynebacterium choanae]
MTDDQVTIQPVFAAATIAHSADAAKLFAWVGGTKSTDTVLLESADIASKNSLQSLLVVKSSLRITCRGQQVTVTPLTRSGEHIAAYLDGKLIAAGISRSTTATDLAGGTAPFGQVYCYDFPAVEEVDERKRLTATSTLLPLKLLQHDEALRDEQQQWPLIAGGFAFDYLETFETLHEVPQQANTFPDYQFMLAEIVIGINYETQQAVIRATGVDAYADELTDSVTTLAAKCAEFAAQQPATETAPDASSSAAQSADDASILEVSATMSDATFCDHVRRLKGHIDAGDVYQAMPSRGFVTTCPDAFAAYGQLKLSNPSPYMFYVRGIAEGEVYELFGASPESSLKYSADTNQVELYPIAGTMPRGLDASGQINHELDIRAELALRTDAKELAEHTMLVDLARNDLARVARPRTRQVAELLKVDRYSRVIHLVSRVTAQLSDDLDALDAYRACMNMGTLTGAPKIMATNLLRDTEQQRRGTYGGAVGYLKGNGDMDTCIVIRSAFVTGGQALVQAGAGVVRDSIPQREADESLHKAWAVLAALAAAQGKTLHVTR